MRFRLHELNFAWCTIAISGRVRNFVCWGTCLILTSCDHSIRKKEIMRRTYEINPRPDLLGGGWNLKFIEDGLEAGGGVFSVPDDDPLESAAWWDSMPDARRAHWLKMTSPPTPAAARLAYLLAEAYNDALDEGEAWVSPTRRDT